MLCVTFFCFFIITYLVFQFLMPLATLSCSSCLLQNENLDGEPSQVQIPLSPNISSFRRLQNARTRINTGYFLLQNNIKRHTLSTVPPTFKSSNIIFQNASQLLHQFLNNASSSPVFHITSIRASSLTTTLSHLHYFKVCLYYCTECFLYSLGVIPVYFLKEIEY